MTIYKVTDRHGNIIRYQARIERKELGKMRRNFSAVDEAVAWVMEIHNSIPCRSAGWAHQEVKIKDLPLHGGDGRGRLVIKNQPVMRINGCTLRRGPGRCEPMDTCEHYLAPGGCLDMAFSRGWEGWSVIGVEG